MPWKVEHLEYLEKLSERYLTERCEIGDEFFFKKKFLKNLTDPRLKELLTTPLSGLSQKERDAYYLLFAKDVEAQDLIEIDGKKYNKRVMNMRLIDIIHSQLLHFNANLDSDSFEITPVFSLKNGTDIMTGFMSFTRDPNDDHHIVEIGLFSFDINDKSFGRQVWEDFDEQLINYLSRGYKIEWEAYKGNNACKHYDELIKQFNGSKEELSNSFVKYRLGFNQRMA